MIIITRNWIKISTQFRKYRHHEQQQWNRRIINEKEEKAGKRHLYVQSIVDWARLGRKTTGTLYLSRTVNKVTGGSAS